MFHDWSNVYLMMGGAAGALIGLLFIVATINTGRRGSGVSEGSSVYLTPVVFHFAVVLLVSAVTEAPLSDRIAAGLIGACAAVGAVYSVRVALRIIDHKTPAPPHWTDFWCYGAAPATVYTALAASAGIALKASPSLAANGVAAALMALLLISIRNAWDLVTWLTQRQIDDGADRSNS